MDNMAKAILFLVPSLSLVRVDNLVTGPFRGTFEADMSIFQKWNWRLLRSNLKRNGYWPTYVYIPLDGPWLISLKVLGETVISKEP